MKSKGLSGFWVFFVDAWDPCQHLVLRTSQWSDPNPQVTEYEVYSPHPNSHSLCLKLTQALLALLLTGHSWFKTLCYFHVCLASRNTNVWNSIRWAERDCKCQTLQWTFQKLPVSACPRPFLYLLLLLVLSGSIVFSVAVRLLGCLLEIRRLTSWKQEHLNLWVCLCIGERAPIS